MNGSPYNRKYDVSVILLCFNQEKIINLTLEALLQQDFQGSYEVIVCDDGSFSDLFVSLRDKFDEAKIPLRYVWQQNRLIRTAQSRNNGVKLSQGRIILFLDGDMIPALNLVRMHMEVRDKRKKLLVAGNRLWVYSKDVDLVGLSISEALPLLRKHAVIREDINKRQIEWSKSKKPWKACFTCNLSVDWFPGLFLDENFVGWGADDWEMACRLCVRHKYVSVYNNNLIAYQYQFSDLDFNVVTRNRHEEIVCWFRNVVYFVDKYPDLDLGELFESFKQFELNLKTNLWSVRKKKLKSYNLKQIVKNIRDWLEKNEVCF